MASTYVNDLRLNELATGDGSGTWGTTTNTNLELIAEGLSFGTEAITTNADTHTSTVADGATDPARSMFIKYTGTLDSACTITIAPNTLSRVHFIENGTSGSQNIIISQGSGANVTIPPGDVKVVYLDGAGSGAAVVDAFASLSVVDLKVQDDLTVTDAITASGVITGLTLEATGDTSAGDNAAIGYTAAEGLILTGQGSTNDVTIKNDADADVLEIPTGTVNVTMAGTLDVVGDITGSTLNADGDTAAGDNAAIGYTAAEGLILTGQGSTSDITLKNDADATVFTVPTGTDDILFPDGAKAMFGASSDLQIYHDGSNSYINETGAGDLYILASNEIRIQDANQSNFLYAVEDGDLRLYHNGSEKLRTAATGVTVTGGITTTTASSIEGGVVFNEASADVDFRVESNNDTHAIFVDAGNGRIGINCDSPLNTDLQVGTNSGSIAMGEAASGNGTCRLKFQGSDSGKNWQIATNNQVSGAFEIDLSDANGGTAFTGTPVFYIANSGNVVLTYSLTVGGSVSKASGSFKIPHPLEAKKDTHHLVHSFVEGPQADNLYRGKVTLVDGTATQNIDTVAGMTEGTFSALNREVQCFTTNETGWTAVKGSVSGNVLTITAQENTCTDTISWMVIGERKDQHMYDTDWTDDNGKVIVEPEVGSGDDAPGPGAD